MTIVMNMSGYEIERMEAPLWGHLPNVAQCVLCYPFPRSILILFP